MSTARYPKHGGLHPKRSPTTITVKGYNVADFDHQTSIQPKFFFKQDYVRWKTFLVSSNVP